MKIMILEDEQVMVNLLKTLLSIEGYDVIVPDNLADVSPKFILSSGVAVIFMDVNLHTQSSIPLVKEIRKNKRGRKLHIIMTSGIDLQRECLEAGANEFLLKPYMPEELIKILKSVESSK